MEYLHIRRRAGACRRVYLTCRPWTANNRLKRQTARETADVRYRPGGPCASDCSCESKPSIAY
eukprot:8440684-Pyramimonas_sp.AAC.1